MQFDPNLTSSSEFGIFGVPSTFEEANIILLPVPWEVTTSYGVGASHGPRIIRKASEQIDLFDIETGKPYEAGIFMAEYPAAWKDKNDHFKAIAQKVIQAKTNMEDNLEEQATWTAQVNQACAEMVDWVYAESKRVLDSGKKLALVGGDHSTPLGAIKAIAEKYKGNFGILHIDAHADLRNAYQGFKHSHASIMYNVMNLPLPPKKLVQIGIRDFCEEEMQYLESMEGKIKTHFDIQLKRQLFEGKSWQTICDEIVKDLPENVFISFDIDGLDPAMCPSTGTPVAGGLSLDQVYYLFYRLHQSGKKLIGFDLNEVSTGGAEEAEWDGNVGARVLYKLCGWLNKSN